MSAPGTARWGDYLRRYFGLRAGETMAVLPDVMPVANIAEEAPELRYYRNERRWVAHVSVPAGGAGNYSKLLLSVPASATRLVVVERFMFLKATASTVIVVVENASGAAQLGARFLDTRPLSDPAGTGGPALDGTPCFYTGSTPAGLGAFNTRIDWVANSANVPTWSPFFPGVVLHPGGPAVAFQNYTANEAVDFYVSAYDVPLHGSELA